MKFYDISLSTNIGYVAKHGPAKGIILSKIRDMIALTSGYGGDGYVSVPGKNLQETTGIPSRTIQKNVSELIDESVLIKQDVDNKKKGTRLTLCQEYMPQLVEIQEITSKSVASTKTPEEKEAVYLQLALLLNQTKKPIFISDLQSKENNKADFPFINHLFINHNYIHIQISILR